MFVLYYALKSSLGEVSVMFGIGIGAFAFVTLLALFGIRLGQLGQVVTFGDIFLVIWLSFLIGVFCQIGLFETIKKIIEKE